MTSIDLSTFFTGTIPDGAELIWSTDPTSQDGVDPIIDASVSDAGIYYAYYSYEENSCFSAPSEIVIGFEPCCDLTDDLVISEDETWDSPRAYGGNVIVTNGATLTINTYVEFGEFKKLIIQDGGTVIVAGASAMLNDCPDASRWDGIEVQSGGNLIVDEGYIYSALYGIHALPGSSIDVSTLVAFGTGWTQGVGIWLEGNANVVRLFRSKIGGFYSGIQCDNGDNYYNIDQGEITDCFTGIDLNYTSARINDFDIIARNDAINAFQSPGLLIENNYLNTPDNNTYSDSDGVNMWWCAGSVLRNNTIGTNWQAPRTGISLYISNGGTIRDGNSIRGARTGIFAFSTDFSIIENDISVVSEGNYNRGALTLMYGNGNQILNNHIEAQNVTFGVNTRLCTGTQIENNKITTLYNATYHRAAGIKSEACTGEIIANNVVTGKGNADAIIATNTVGNTYDCNEAVVEGNKEALSVLYNSQGQSVKGNNLSANGHDLLIRSIIGTQNHEGNEFMGGDALAEGDLIAAGSRFFVNSTYAGHMPGNPQPEDWFTDEPTIHNYYICANDPGPDWMPLWDDEDELCAYYRGVVDEYGYSSKEYLLMVQSIVRYSQQRIQYELPNCISSDGILSDCWVLLAQAEKEISQIDYAIAEESDELARKIAALSGAYKEGRADQYLTANENRISELTTTLSSTDFVRNAQANRAKKLLTRIDCTDPILDRVLPILKEYIEFLQTEDKSTFDYSKLIEYSRLCADDYGPYVHLARGLVYPIADEYFDQYDNCRSVAIQPLIGSGSSHHAGTSLYPNPSTGLATIDFVTESSGSLQVMNISGKVLIELEFKDQFQLNIDLSKYPGVNMIHIHHEDGAREVLKHISFK